MASKGQAAGRFSQTASTCTMVYRISLIWGHLNTQGSKLWQTSSHYKSNCPVLASRLAVSDRRSRERQRQKSLQPWQGQLSPLPHHSPADVRLWDVQQIQVSTAAILPFPANTCSFPYFPCASVILEDHVSSRNQMSRRLSLAKKSIKT